MAGKHKRACFACGNMAMHEDNYGEKVKCKKCGSMDTRRIGKNNAPSERLGGIEITSVFGRARITVRDAKHAISVDVGRDGLKKLVAELQAVLEGGA